MKCERGIDQHDTSMGQRKNLSPQQESNPAPRWLDSSVGRALHWYRRGMGLNPAQAWIFFRL